MMVTTLPGWRCRARAMISAQTGLSSAVVNGSSSARCWRRPAKPSETLLVPPARSSGWSSTALIGSGSEAVTTRLAWSPIGGRSVTARSPAGKAVGGMGQEANGSRSTTRTVPGG